ncbi:MAG: KEOPS complex subunit Pcc1 [Sulfolobales archaeon]|nr:KEOPS complex subunit Pcc1 [Sulfolobales archaeon]MDW7968833.1 KEOPS complex subunit Pcc1 [Sulfolobales archaeon]
MKVALTLYIELSDAVLASAVYRALRPDDVDVPKGFKLRSDLVNSSIIYELEVEIDNNSKIYTLGNIVDDVIQHVSLAEAAIRLSTLNA